MDEEEQKDEAEKALQEIVDAEFKVVLGKQKVMMEQPGAVPNSEKFLNCEDDEGNQLWRITCIKEQVVDYIKILKKNGFVGQ